jgi:hypothetical protein
MRQVTLLSLAQVQDPLVRNALQQVQDASADNVINDVGQSGAALSTIKNAAADTVPYFTGPTTVSTTPLTATGRAIIGAGSLAGTGFLVATSNLSDVASVPAARSNIMNGLPAFSAYLTSHQNGIADSTPTFIVWQGLRYNVGGFFASNIWQPPAGRVHIDATVYCFANVSMTTGAFCDIFLTKNGSATYRHPCACGPGFVGLGVSCDDVCSGSDQYGVMVYITGSGGNNAAHGDPSLTFFNGHWLSP